MSDIVLIAGGSGLVGRALRMDLLSRGYQVRLLGRGLPSADHEYQWDPSAQWLDESALKGIQYIVNLAGSNVGESRWTNQRKTSLINSRIDSTRLLVNKCIELKLPIKKFIQASATGYYGMAEGDKPCEESSPHGKDFLAKLTYDWESETKPLTHSPIPLLVLRLGVVLTRKGGALATMAKPVKLFLGMPIGSGNQYISWIHIDDVVGFIRFSMEKSEIAGIYNLVSPSPVTNRIFMKTLGKALQKPIWPIHVPSGALHLLMGEQAGIVTKGNNVSCKKLINSGYLFQHPNLLETLQHELSE